VIHVHPQPVQVTECCPELHHCFIVMPSKPKHNKALYDQGSYGGMLRVMPPYLFCDTLDAAHAQARKLSKHHSIPYFVAEVRMVGQWAPPPPQFEPIYEGLSSWQKP
jgi:hypothetical protein